MSEHVDTETVSAFREDLLPGDQAARVAAHLVACARCAEIDARLASVSALLASTPVPPMPAALTARIEAALAAEATRPQRARAAETQSAQSARTLSPETTVPAAQPPRSQEVSPAPRGPARWRRGRRPARRPGLVRLALQVSSAAAVIVILAGIGYGLVRLAGGSQSGTPSSAGGGAVPSTGRHFMVSKAPGPAALSPAGALPVVTSGTNYQPGRIAAQASAVLGQADHGAYSPQRAAGIPASAFGDFDKVRACVTRVTGGTGPRLVDVARYRGQPAMAIMVPAGGGVIRVWVVGSGCGPSASDVLAQASVHGSG